MRWPVYPRCRYFCRCFDSFVVTLSSLFSRHSVPCTLLWLLCSLHAMQYSCVVTLSPPRYLAFTPSLVSRALPLNASLVQDKHSGHNEFPGPLTASTRWHANTQLCTSACTTGSSNFESFFKTPVALTPDSILSVSENVMTYALVCLTVRYDCTGVSPPLCQIITRARTCAHTQAHTHTIALSHQRFLKKLGDKFVQILPIFPQIFVQVFTRGVRVNISRDVK